MKVVATGVTAAVAVLLAAAGAASKEGARGRLLTQLPLGAAPGATVRVEWRVDVPDGKGGRAPFGAGGMYVRLLSRTGTGSSVGYDAASAPHTEGRYAAAVRVPAGRIGGVRLGLRGTSCGPSGCRRADLAIPIANDPFTSPGGVRCDVAALRTTLTAFVRAYNAGDVDRLDRLFSVERFVWYSSSAPGTRLLGDAANREALIPYFRRRHGRGDRLKLLTFRFNGYERQRDIGHFELTARRRADDFRGGRWLSIVGKGALDCAEPPVKIAVMNLGGSRS